MRMVVAAVLLVPSSGRALVTLLKRNSQPDDRIDPPLQTVSGAGMSVHKSCSALQIE